MGKRALICIQGINANQGYLYNSINKSSLKDKYDTICDSPTEKFFDKNQGFFFKLLGKLGDSLGDVWAYYTNKQARQAVCRSLREHIELLQSAGYEVDIIAHSLGTVIALSCGPNTPANQVQVNKTTLLGSPLGVGNLFARLKTNGHTERYSNNFKTLELQYVWSEKDYVSKVLTGRIIDILSNRSVNTPAIQHSGDRHAVQDYIGFIE